MITITDRSNLNTENLMRFPSNDITFPKKKESDTLFFPNKKYIVISARVHPSEVASSYVLQGIINALLEKSEYSKFLKDTVLLIVPMLNPDGVYNGYTRLDTNGYNLNAHYKWAGHKTPSIKALTDVIKFVNKNGNLHAYLDLHSHLTKRGIFFFGNPINQVNYKEALEIPFFFGQLQKDFKAKTSSKTILYHINYLGFGVKQGESTSRKRFYQITKKNRLFVLETNYWGHKVSHEELVKTKSLKHNLRRVDSFKQFFTVKKFRQMGKNLFKTFGLSINFSKLDSPSKPNSVLISSGASSNDTLNSSSGSSGISEPEKSNSSGGKILKTKLTRDTKSKKVMIAKKKAIQKRKAIAKKLLNTGRISIEEYDHLLTNLNGFYQAIFKSRLRRSEQQVMALKSGKKLSKYRKRYLRH